MNRLVIQAIKFLTIFFISTDLYGQGGTDTLFKEKKNFIDSLAFSIDTSKSLSQKRLVGTLNLGNYSAFCYYSKRLRKIAKIDCYFSTDSIGQKTFYYYQNDLIKVKDNGASYYNFHNLVDSSGTLIDQLKSRELLEFSNESISITERLLE